MFLKVKGNGFSEYIYKEIANITDHSILHINDVKYEREKKIVLLLERYQFREMDKKLLGTIKNPIYDRNVKIKSHIIIERVINCKIQNNYTTKVSETIIGGGIVIRGSKIYICSQDDYHGEPFYLIEIDIDGLDITINDLDNQ